MVSRPVGGILSSVSRRLGDHPSERPTSERSPANRFAGREPIPTLGLAPGGVCRAAWVTPSAGALLPHRFTLTCARSGRTRAEPSAVCSLWHFPSGHPAWPLASTLPFGVPTFLDPVILADAVPRSPGRLTIPLSVAARPPAAPPDPASPTRVDPAQFPNLGSLSAPGRTKTGKVRVFRGFWGYGWVMR